MTAITSIVVGVDFTACSAAALTQAIRLAAHSGAKLRVVHVIDTVVITELESALSPLQKNIRQGLTSDALAAWTGFAKNVPGAEKLSIDVVINNRIEGILQHAREHGADLIVLGAYGERPVDVGLGTVATSCVRRGSRDVLLVRDTHSGPFTRVLAAVDFSPTSIAALERASAIAAADGAELVVAHVFKAPWREVHYHAPSVLVDPGQQAQYRAGLQRRLEAIVKPIAGVSPSLRVRTLCVDEDSHRSGIVSCAGSVGADLIVLGTRGKTNLRDFFLGSTAERALAESRCSVLAVAHQKT